MSVYITPKKKKDPNRTRFTLGRNLTLYPWGVITTTAKMLLVNVFSIVTYQQKAHI